MLNPDFKSFVGWIPTPMVHGPALGELANMAVAGGSPQLAGSRRL